MLRIYYNRSLTNLVCEIHQSKYTALSTLSAHQTDPMPPSWRRDFMLSSMTSRHPIATVRRSILPSASRGLAAYVRSGRRLRDIITAQCAFSANRKSWSDRTSRSPRVTPGEARTCISDTPNG